MNTAATLIRPRPVAQPQALPVRLQGELLQAAELRTSADGTRITVQLLLAQPGGLPPVCACYQPRADAASIIHWKQAVRDYVRGRQVQVDGLGLRTRTVDGQRVVMLDHTTAVRLLQPPFDARAAAAGAQD